MSGIHHYSMSKPNGIKAPHCREGYFLPGPDLWEERMQRSTPGFLTTFAQLSPSVSHPPPVSPHCLLPRLWYWVVRVLGPERRHGYTRVLTCGLLCLILAETDGWSTKIANVAIPADGGISNSKLSSHCQSGGTTCPLLPPKDYTEKKDSSPLL